MDKEVLVSVIIPVYNAEEHLRECLDSLVNQTLKEIEIIFVDDSSTDNSVEVIRFYMKRDSRIHLFHNIKNEGAFCARRTGVLASKSEYIMHMDPDDYLDPDACKIAYEAIKQHKADVMQFTIGVEDYTNNNQTKNWLTNYLKARNIVLNQRELQTALFIERSVATALVGKIYSRKACLLAYSKMPEVYCNIEEDQFQQFYYSCFVNTYCGIETKPLYWYRRGLGLSNSNKMNLRKYESYCKMAILYKHINTFASQRQNDTHLTECAHSLGVRMCEDCARNWSRQVPKEEKGEAFILYWHYWSFFSESSIIFEKLTGLNVDQQYSYYNYKDSNTNESKPNKKSIVKPMDYDDIAVSVIIPVYNAEKYLHECLDSVINQTLKEIEIICVDDGSTDDSLVILRDYQKKDHRIIIFVQENCGSGPARNKGIISSHGEFVIFMDADDYYPEDTVLEKLFYSAKNNEALICGGSFSTLSVDGKIKTVFDQQTYWGYTFFSDRNVRYQDYQFDYGYHRFIYNREFLIDNDLLFPHYWRYQDPPFFVRTMIAAESFYTIHDITYCCRQNDHYKSILTDKRKVHDCILGFNDVLTIAKEHFLRDLYCLTIDRCFVRGQTILNAAKGFQDPEIDNALNELVDTIDLHFWNSEIVDYIVPKERISFIQNYAKTNPYIQDFRTNRTRKEYTIPEYIQTNQKYANTSLNPIISVIIPVYNVEQYLRECLDSIVHQTLDDIEIVCVNDGSTDESLFILEEYQAKDPRITVISEKNKGLSGARNAGMQYAQGDYLYFIDSDDILDLKALEFLTQLALKQDLDAVAFGIEPFYETKQLYQSHRFTYYDNAKQATRVLSGFDFMKEMKDQGSFIPSACRVIWRRTTLQNNGILFPEGIIHEDNLFSFLAYMSADRVMQIPDKFYKRRVRPNSLMTVAKSQKNVIGYFASAMGILEYAFRDTYTLDKEKEILRAFTELVSAAKRDYLSISREEKNKVVFSKEIENLMFDQFIVNDIKAQQSNAEHEQELNHTLLELAETRKSLQFYQQEVDLIRASWTYKIGRFITFIPRKVRGGIRCYKENGWRYTFRRTLEHLGLRHNNWL